MPSKAHAHRGDLDTLLSERRTAFDSESSGQSANASSIINRVPCNGDPVRPFSKRSDEGLCGVAAILPWRVGFGTLCVGVCVCLFW